jgi:hypothetical protein
MVKSPLLFPELDTLDLTGLGIGDEGAAEMARVLEQNPAVRRVVLTDNKIGEEGGASLGAALTLNDTLQVSCNVFMMLRVKWEVCGSSTTAALHII